MTDSPLPLAFRDMMLELLGEEAQALFDSLDEEPPTSIRLSLHKASPSLLPATATPVPWCSWGYYLAERPTFTGKAAFHAGQYYVQEASSMLLTQIQPLLPNTAMTALDLCAAPGGKSTLLLDLLPEGSVLLANEVVQHRANVLAENLQKWGNPRHIVSHALPDKFTSLGATFDLVLVDAPCSGEGMFRKDKSARLEWTEHSPQACAERQRSILADVWDSLLPDGLLVYSTCTLNRLENEDIVAYIVETLGASPISLGEIDGGVQTSPYSPYPCYRMMPHRAKGEGQFMAVFRKETEAPQAPKSVKTKSKSREQAQEIPQEVYSYIVNPTEYIWERLGDEVRAYPKAVYQLLNRLRSLRLPIVSAGILVAQIKGKSIIPHTALALSTAFRPDSFEWIELSEVQTIEYLSREALQIDGVYQQGYKVVHHGGVALGFIKYLGNRSNNLYPNEWRIRHAHKL